VRLLDCAITMIPPTVSLVKYDNPVLVSTSGNGKKAAGKKGLGSEPLPPVVSPSPKTSAAEAKKQQQTEDILNSILPPREWQEGGKLWVQSVSSTPATRSDVVKLQEQLDTKLVQRQARETGICPVRRELYAQTFDELIREVTINCAERGLLLLRIRDEIRMTIAAYQTMYESSVAFGMRKALQAEQGKADSEQLILDLQEEKKELEAQLAASKAKCDEIERREAERRAVEQRKHEEELQLHKRTSQQLKAQLESILAPSKK